MEAASRPDEATQLDYQAALDSYESAKETVPRTRSAEEVSKVVDALSSGPYSLVCVRAGVAGTERPEHRPPCFFNPQHGPSVADVLWTSARRGSRLVPACAQDAARVASGEAPEVRTVRIGSRTVPYWEAGAAFLPYTAGYFGGSAMTAWAVLPPDADGGRTSRVAAASPAVASTAVASTSAGSAATPAWVVVGATAGADLAPQTVRP